MWNNYFSGRPRRDLPTPNYREQSSEDEDDFRSPSRPPVTRAGSPAELAIPQLNDNVDEDLIHVRQVLQNVGHSPLFRKLKKEESSEEVVNEGFVVGTPGHAKVGEGNIAMPEVRYDTATGEDEPGVYGKLSTLKTEFCHNDPKFWFANFERTIKHFGVKSQTTKKEALINQLTKAAIDECKDLIALDEDEAGDTPYKTLKVELLKLYGPRPEDSYAKAASRVLVGKPSTLAKQLINDLCECGKSLECKCCAKTIFGMWIKNLPTYIRTHISDESFTVDTYKAVLDKADRAWLSHKTETPSVSAIKAENKVALENSTDFENPAVAAIRRANRGGNFGGRGGRGGARGDGRGGRGGRGGGRGGRALGPKHPQALEGSCFIHHQYGPEAWSCADRHKCPMRDIESPRPKHNRNIPIEKPEKNDK